MKRFTLAGLFMVLSMPALADTDVFLNAVYFALTGSDNTKYLQIVDRPNCVFMINAKIKMGSLLGRCFT